jgi:hypothetical protein
MQITSNEIEVIRDYGRSLNDRGFIEVNLISGEIVWANEFVLNTYGFKLEQLQGMTIFSVIPEKFHDWVRDMISDQTKGKIHKLFIWPWKNSDGKLIWWYSELFDTNHPFYWFKMGHMNTTTESGPEYTSMSATMEATNNFNDLFHKMADLQSWTEEHVVRLGGEITETRDSIDNIKLQMRSCLSAANRAADLALENVQMINMFKNEIIRELSNHTTEILMLITTDTIHDKRIQIFEKHMKETTNRAILEIQNQAEKSGKNLTRKITIPVGAIAAIAALIQWLIQTLHSH